MGLLRLLRLELLFDCGLVRFTMLCLTSDKGGDGIFEFISDLLGKLSVEAGLLFCLLPQGIERVAEFA